MGAEAYVYSGTVVSEDPPPGTETEPQFQDAAANAPLEFKTGAGSSGAQHSWAPKPGEDYGSQTYSQFPAYSEAGMAGAYYQDYYSSGYYQEVEPAQAPPQEMSTDSSFIDDEAVGTLLSRCGICVEAWLERRTRLAAAVLPHRHDLGFVPSWAGWLFRGVWRRVMDTGWCPSSSLLGFCSGWSLLGL